MLTKKLRIWIRAVRPFSFTGSLIPVILGSVLAFTEDKFNIGYFFLSAIAIILLHAGVNLLSDHDDFVRKVDTKDSYGSSGILIENLLKLKDISKVGKCLLVIGVLIGLFLAYKKGLVVLLIGLIGALGGYSYTGRPLSLKYRGLGAPLVFLLFGPLMVIGSYYVQTQTVTFSALWVSIPVGLLTTAILHVNDIRDIVYDKKAGIKTLSILIGKNKSKKIYYGLIIFSYLSVLVMSLYNIVPYWSLICFVTAPSALKDIKKLYSSESESDIIALDKETAQLQGQLGVLLIVSILMPSVFK